jgi:hypothetical protein
MNSLINLMTVIGVDKTLIIACGKYAMREYIALSDAVAFYFLSGNMLKVHDSGEKGELQAVIECSGCTQIVFLGLLDESMQTRLRRHVSLHSLRAGLRFETPLLPRNTDVLATHTRDQVLLEQHVSSQCSSLMEYHFIRERVAMGQLRVRGIVGTPEGENHRTVFKNGILYNDLVSMN